MVKKTTITKKTPKVVKGLKEVKREVIDSDHIKITYSDKSEQVIFS